MATVYYTASSLDGFIVDDADSLDWLTSRTIDANGPFGYEAFAKSVGALVMGSATYEWIVKNHPGDWMYEQPSWVLTSRPEIVEAGHPVQTFDGDVAEMHAKLVSAAAGRDVWVVGGGHAPCSLGTGAPVLPLRSEWRLEETAVNGDFVCARWASL
jgi:dihydrofolate reductase